MGHTPCGTPARRACLPKASRSKRSAITSGTARWIRPACTPKWTLRGSVRLRTSRWGACYETEGTDRSRSEEHTSELQSRVDLVCRLLLEKTKIRTAVFPARTRKVNANNSAALNGLSTQLILFSVT